ncbi:MAG TPA: hypothetical protein VFU02_23930, partial [Polyangiaceae bacterium]|nr:hypothetical protein [Polyangiaceae bacterium]
NLFVESPNIGQLSSMYFYAWKQGLKTTYYLRSRPATRIAKATVQEDTVATDSAGDPRAERGWTPEPPGVAPALPQTLPSGTEVVSCSLENPETCEACQ